MKNWEKEYNKMAELNEFFGLPYDEHTDNLIKNFIHQALIEYKEETLKLIKSPYIPNNQCIMGSGTADSIRKYFLNKEIRAK